MELTEVSTPTLRLTNMETAHGLWEDMGRPFSSTVWFPLPCDVFVGVWGHSGELLIGDTLDSA